MRSFYRITTASIALLPVLAAAGVANAADIGAQMQAVETGTIITPSSGVSAPGIAHTNVKIFVPRNHNARYSAPSGFYETPASLACIYGVVKAVAGCNPSTLKTVSSSGSKMIAIVDAYDDPNALSDLTVYSKQYGLPAPSSSNFEVVFAGGTRPNQDSTGGWELEESLDVDMAHALAPQAKVVLVEAASASDTDLLKAEKVAISMVEAAGGGEVSNSWASSEFTSEAKQEHDFSGKKVVVFASAGDSPGTGAPAALPNVVAVGGTTIMRSKTGNFLRQTSWGATGGGLSLVIPTPAYQSTVTAVVGTHRGLPDIAAVANPQSGVWVYDSLPYGGQALDWVIVGGTSAASPASAAMVNDAGTFNASTTAELTEIYANLGNGKAFVDVKTGPCGNAPSGKAAVGYDLCTGVGAPYSTVGK